MILQKISHSIITYVNDDQTPEDGTDSTIESKIAHW